MKPRVLLTILILTTSSWAEGLDRAFFAEKIVPFVDNHCLECHDSDESEGGIDLEPFLTAEDVLRDRGPWEKVMKQLRAGAMPPDGKMRPPAKEQAHIINWLDRALVYIDTSKPADPGKVTVRRLNRTEYNNTIRDMFGLHMDLATSFPDDDVGYGFDNIGDVLSVSPLRMEQYLQAAQTVTANLFYRPDELPLDNHSLAVFYDRNERWRFRNFSDRGIELVPGADLSYPFVFPVAGEYEVVFRAWGDPKPNEKDGSTNEKWLEEDGKDFQRDPCAKPPVAARILLDDREVAFIEVDEGTPTYAKQMYFRTRFTAKPGRQTLHFLHAFPTHIPESERKVHWGKALSAPRIGIRDIRLQGPVSKGKIHRTPLHQALLQATPENYADVLNQLMRTAFRRPPTSSELDRMNSFFQARLASGADFSQALEFAVQAILVSPHFLMRLEDLSDSASTVHPVGAHALASRLSYFLWNSLPDRKLMHLADEGKLVDTEVLGREVFRMLDDPKSVAFEQNFFGQWLELRKLVDLRLNPELFPKFSSALKADLQEETLRFAGEIVRENRPALELLTAQSTHLNGNLAKLYGISGFEKDDPFRRVSLEGQPRQGILTQGSILMLTSYPDRTSPTRRGNWILSNILGDEPPPPPANVPELEANEAVDQNLSLRERLVQHRVNPSCVSCHETMDSIGFGFENFDAIGQWRDKDGDQPIDSAGGLPTGERFANAQELIGILSQREEEFVRHLVSKLLTYALGRGVEYYDRPAIDQILANTAAQDHRFRDLLLEVVLSRPFLMQRAQQEKE